MFIPGPDLDFLPIPDPWVRKALDPGSGSATLYCIYLSIFEGFSYFKHNSVVFFAQSHFPYELYFPDQNGYLTVIGAFTSEYFIMNDYNVSKSFATFVYA